MKSKIKLAEILLKAAIAEIESASRPRITEGMRLLVNDPDNKNHYWLATVKFIENTVLFIELDNGLKFKFSINSPRIIGKGIDKKIDHPILKEETWKFTKFWFVKPDEDMLPPENMRYLKKG